MGDNLERNLLSSKVTPLLLFDLFNFRREYISVSSTSCLKKKKNVQETGTLVTGGLVARGTCVTGAE